MKLFVNNPTVTLPCMQKSDLLENLMVSFCMLQVEGNFKGTPSEPAFELFLLSRDFESLSRL